MFIYITFPSYIPGACTMFVRYKILRSLPAEYERECRCLNLSSLVVGSLSILGLCLVANFQVSNPTSIYVPSKKAVVLLGTCRSVVSMSVCHYHYVQPITTQRLTPQTSYLLHGYTSISIWSLLLDRLVCHVLTWRVCMGTITSKIPYLTKYIHYRMMICLFMHFCTIRYFGG